ncbi:MAG: hypothetical protein MR364_07715 [Oscillospiraceae bacterium]|nr:hypothetical protein [Oscillospiraceae bacterium]
MKIYLFRSVTERDIDAEGRVILSSNLSNIQQKFSDQEIIQESVAHIFYSANKRGVIFSFSTDYDIAKKWNEDHENKGVFFIELDTEKVNNHILQLFPAFRRKDWIYKLSKIKMPIIDPVSNKSRTALALLQPAQRSATSLAHSMGEVHIICKNLELKKVKDTPHYSLTDNINNVDSFFDSLANTPTIEELKAFKEEINKEIRGTKVKNQYLIRDLFPKLEKEIQAAN